MSDKEMNMAILNKLYEIADKVFSEGVNVKEGITPHTNENVSERKETASTAKIVAISIGVPVCLDIPLNNMLLDIASNKPLNAVVGDCLCGVGKVVHTLPLPPPRSKRMSEITKVNH